MAERYPIYAEADITIGLPGPHSVAVGLSSALRAHLAVKP